AELISTRIASGQDRRAHGMRVWRSTVAEVTAAERSIQRELVEVLLRSVTEVARRLRAMMAIPRAFEDDPVVDSLANGHNLEGKNVAGVADEVEQAFARLTESQAAAIARTELQEASNAGAVEQYKLDEVEQKEWFTADDERVCPVCDSLNGQVVGIDEVFSSG